MYRAQRQYYALLNAQRIIIVIPWRNLQPSKVFSSIKRLVLKQWNLPLFHFRKWPG